MSQTTDSKPPVDGNGAQMLDPLLENLTGKWKLDRKAGKRESKNNVDVMWVLNHQFLQVHMKDVKRPPQYEALILIGYSNEDKRYVVHWTDTFGGKYSEKGYGTRDGNSIKFVFPYPDGEVHNTFTWRPETKTWRCLIEQPDKDGKWSVFAEDTLMRPK